MSKKPGRRGSFSRFLDYFRKKQKPKKKKTRASREISPTQEEMDCMNPVLLSLRAYPFISNMRNQMVMLVTLSDIDLKNSRLCCPEWKTAILETLPHCLLDQQFSDLAKQATDEYFFSSMNQSLKKENLDLVIDMNKRLYQVLEELKFKTLTRIYVCQYCKQSSPDLRKCKGCELVFYCQDPGEISRCAPLPSCARNKFPKKLSKCSLKHFLKHKDLCSRFNVRKKIVLEHEIIPADICGMYRNRIAKFIRKMAFYKYELVEDPLECIQIDVNFMRPVSPLAVHVILSFLPPEDLNTASLVCKIFFAVSYSRLFWILYFGNFFSGFGGPEVYYDPNPKKTFYELRRKYFSKHQDVWALGKLPIRKTLWGRLCLKKEVNVMVLGSNRMKELKVMEKLGGEYYPDRPVPCYGKKIKLKHFSLVDWIGSTYDNEVTRTGKLVDCILVVFSVTEEYPFFESPFDDEDSNFYVPMQIPSILVGLEGEKLSNKEDIYARIKAKKPVTPMKRVLKFLKREKMTQYVFRTDENLTQIFDIMLDLIEETCNFDEKYLND